MSLSRNRIFLRSIGFGVIAKLFGLLMIFIGLPVIAHALPIDDYALFLYGMSASALIGFVFNGFGVLISRDLAHVYAKNDKNSIHIVENESFGLFLAVFVVLALSVLPSVGLFSSGKEEIVLYIVLSLGLAQGLFQFGDFNRVAARTDHISSLWQLISTILLTVSIIYFRESGLVTLVLIYFGIPVLFQGILLAHLWLKNSRIPFPVFHPLKVTMHAKMLTPIFIYQISQYSKTYISGAIVLLFSDAVNYGRSTTLILLIARLTNPLSLITRPLMPAYIDALAKKDRVWIVTARRILFYLLCVTICIVPIIGYSLNPNVVMLVLPPSASMITHLEIVCVISILIGYAYTALYAPLFFASQEGTKNYAVINISVVCITLIAGAVVTHVYGSLGMLMAMAVGATTNFIILTIRIYFKELSVDSEQTIVLQNSNNDQGA